MATLPPIGHKVSFTKTVSDSDLRPFAEVSGDNQPLHLDENFGQRTRFGKRIAHGMLSAGFISAVLGTRLYPSGIVIYLSQTLQFRRPVAVGDSITAEAEVLSADPEKNILTLRTDCTNQDGEVVTRGEATVMLDDLKA
jgi:3-hydroxybutyryl-CoA dehydratase